jgi:tetratricopeptide (TPR) repeat protein
METRLNCGLVRPNCPKSLRGLALLSLILAPIVTLHAQQTGGMGVETPSQYEFIAGSRQMVAITVGVRDARGLPLDDKAMVRLISKASVYNRTIPTEANSSATFPNVWEGPYDVEVKCQGYRPVIAHIDVSGGLAFFSTYIYLHPVYESAPSGGPAKGLVLTPRLASEIDKGLASMHKQQYEAAKAHFVKAERIVPNSSDVAYLMGTADQGMKQNEAARANFQKAITLDPANDRAMIALGELQLQTGDAAGAIVTLNQAYAANGAGWRTRYLLASAYAKTGKLRDAEMQADSAVKLAHNNSATPLLLLGDIQAAGGRWTEAKQSWDRVVGECPNCPEAGEARKRLSEASGDHPAGSGNLAGQFTHLAMAPELPPKVEERPWAPPDVDSKEYSVAPDVSCKAEEIIPRAMRRTKLQLDNLEKFGATEHIEHQEIDKSGVPGPLKMHNFYYLVFVFPYKSNSVFLEENRDGGNGVADFPTSLATTGLNSLGINVLQPAYREGYSYQCEGLATIRGQGAWQVRFEEKKDANLDVRRWQRSGTIYNIPLKGRIWLSSTTYDLLRVETDLREPVVNLELTRDHLLVDYGPVNFTAGNTTMWLPWSAEMYLELHGKRYHHRHLLSNYMLFGVDTSHKINRPKNAPPEDAAPNVPPPGANPPPEAPKP